MSNRPKVAISLLGVVLVATLFGSGLRFVPKEIYVYSPPICGPIKDQYENVVRDAGPCPTPPPPPQLEESHWEWTPFWVAAD